jgi:hypothetical protein
VLVAAGLDETGHGRNHTLRPTSPARTAGSCWRCRPVCTIYRSTPTCLCSKMSQGPWNFGRL